MLASCLFACLLLNPVKCENVDKMARYLYAHEPGTTSVAEKFGSILSGIFGRSAARLPTDYVG